MYVCPRTPPSFLDRFPSNRYQNFPNFSVVPLWSRIFNVAPLGSPLNDFDHFFVKCLPHTLSYASDQFFFFHKNVEDFKADKKYSDTFLPTVDGFAAKMDFCFKILETF